MKEKNRESIAQKFYKTRENLDQKREMQKRLISYNPKKANKIQDEISILERDLSSLETALTKADNNYSPSKKEEPTEKELLYSLIAPLDQYMRQGAAALKKRRILLFFARHPKVVLAQMLYLAAKEAEILPKKIAPYKEGAYCDLCTKVEGFCQELVNHSNKRWNHALYSGEFLALYERWNSIIYALIPEPGVGGG